MLQIFEPRKRCYGYVRVSTVKQADEGMSLENQEKYIREWAAKGNWEVVDIMIDPGVSARKGTMLERKGLDRLLNTIKAGEAFVSYTISRITRSTKDLLNIVEFLENKDCKLFVIKEDIETITANGIFKTTLIGALAELESNITSERIRDCIKLKKEKGEYIGRIPYGWKQSAGKGSDLIEDPIEQGIIDYIHRIKGQLNNKYKPYSSQGIADRLNREDIKPPGKSRMWYHTAIENILERKNVPTKGRLRNTEINGISMIRKPVHVVPIPYKVESRLVVKDPNEIKFKQIGINFY